MRNARYDSACYELTPQTVQLSLAGIGRLAYFEDNLEAISVAGPRLVLHLTDEMGSATTSIDHATGELIQRTTYLACGAVNSDYRAERWGSYRNPYEFTGKESDIELGLKYFGVRYYATHLNRWMSADPANIHGLRADMNPYAYVSGQVASAVDPDGQEPITVGVIAVAAVVALAYGTSVVVQASNHNWNFKRVEYGWGGGRGALAAGASAGVGAIATLLVPPLGVAGLGQTGAAIVNGAVSGAIGGAASGAASAAFQRNSSWGEIGAGAGLGALSGAVSGGVGGGLGSGLNGIGGASYIASAGGAVASTGVGAATTALSGDSVDLEDLALSLGTALGSAAGNTGIGQFARYAQGARQGAAAVALYTGKASAVGRGYFAQLIPPAAPYEPPQPSPEVTPADIPMGPDGDIHIAIQQHGAARSMGMAAAAASVVVGYALLEWANWWYLTTFVSAEAGAAAGGAAIVDTGVGTAIRQVNFVRGLGHAMEKHLTGSGPLSLRTLDPGGNLAKWTSHIVQTATTGSGSVRAVAGGQIMEVLPRCCLKVVEP